MRSIVLSATSFWTWGSTEECSKGRMRLNTILLILEGRYDTRNTGAPGMSNVTGYNAKPEELED